MASNAPHAPDGVPSRLGLASLVVAAVGVVFGDIGTSPLYTIKEMFNPHFGLTPNAETVKGLLSLGFWSLILVVTVTISAQNTIDRMPSTVSWSAVSPKCGENASFSVYSGLVPMSPNTTPMAPTTSPNRPALPLSPCPPVAGCAVEEAG